MPNFYVGTAGWSYKDWEGIVYPTQKGRDFHALYFLGEFINIVEINSTFYRPPDSKLSASWLARTEDQKDFFFTAKLHKDFTHQGILDPAMVNQFKHGLAPLLNAGCLRRLLIQFRYDFTATHENRSYLEKLVENFRDVFKLVVEIRHNSPRLKDGPLLSAFDPLRQAGFRSSDNLSIFCTRIN